jgi:hypothetical protein
MELLSLSVPRRFVYERSGEMGVDITQEIASLNNSREATNLGGW